MNNMMSPAVSEDERNLSVHTEHEFLLKLEKAGLVSSLANKVILSKDNELAKKVVRLISNGGFEPSTSQKRAREIMGQNMFGIEEAIQYFGVNPSKQQLAILADIPWSEEVLAACKNTHVLIAVFTMPILDIRGHVADKGLFYVQDWYNKQPFAKEKGEVSWQLVRKITIADSTSKNWDEQQALLSPDEETPSVQVMVYTIIGHYLATGGRLFGEVYVRTSSLDSDGGRVCVGRFDSAGLDVDDSWVDSRYDNLGVASARKQQ